MYSSAIVLALCLASGAFAYPYSIIQDEEGEAYAMMPLSRVRRAEVYGNADMNDPGRVIAGVRGTPIDNENHRLDTNVFATTNIRHHSPISTGGEASYLHKPTHSNFDLKAMNTPQWGTDLKASGRYNFYQDKTTNANVEGFYSRHYGGMPGTMSPDYGVMFNFRKDF